MGEKKGTPIFVCDHGLEDKLLCSLLRASVHSFRHYTTLFLFVIDFLLEIYRTISNPNIFPLPFYFLLGLQLVWLSV